MKTSLTLLAGLLVAFGARLSSAPTVGLSYVSSCSLEGFPTIVGNQSCVNDPIGSGATNPFNFQIPIAVANNNITANVTGFNLSVAATGAAYGAGKDRIPVSIYSGEVAASSRGTYNNYLTTAGPVRQGLLVATISYVGTTSAEQGDYSSSNLYLDLLAGNSFFSSGIQCGQNYHLGSCDTTAATLNYFNRTNGGLTIQLGTPFQLTYTAGSTSSAGGNGADSYFGYTTLNERIDFSLYELNGTPVEVISAAPEPATWSLISLSALCAAFRGKRHDPRSQSGLTTIWRREWDSNPR